MPSIRAVVFFLLFFPSLSKAQDKQVEGQVIDAQTQQALSYASISILNTLKGTMTDEDGKFALTFGESQDSILISYIGYQDKVIALGNTNKLEIKLDPYEYKLAEVIVRPKSALYYIKEAVDRYPGTRSKNPFGAKAFFQERTSLDNDKSNAYQLDRAIFKMYFPDFTDTTKNSQNQLVLYEFKEEGEAKSILMDNKRVRRQAARDAKRKEKRRQRGEVVEDDEQENETKVNINLGDAGAGGPQMSLNLAQTFIEESFFEEAYFKKYTYSFGEDSYYQGRQLMAIDFFNKRKIEFTFSKGTVYLDKEDLAIVAISYNQRVKIPFYINALIKTVAGFKLNTVEMDVEVKNQKFNEYWYPKEVVGDILVQLEQEKKLEDIRLKQFLNIYEIDLDEVEEIPMELRFKKGEDMEPQQQNPQGLQWSDLKQKF